MEKVKENLNKEILKCNAKISWKETEILKDAFDLLYTFKNIFAKKESKEVKNLKDKLLNATKIKVAE